MRRYEATVYDSNRWDGFELRPGDIIISTPPKCGTTWTQMICALLILQEPELPLPLDTLSPWIDMVTRARTEVFADLEAQTHRRFIKTHTPLDGIPNDPTVTYICVGRDPRDVALSMDRHIDNMDIGAFLKARERAAAIDGIELGPLPPPRPRPDGERDRFWQWVDDETPSTHSGGSSLRFTVEHLQTFRDAADDLDVVFLHYDELKADLEGQMRQLAAHLEIEVDEDRWPRLVQAATFESMRSRADTTVPGGGPGALDRPRRVLQPRNERPVARPPRRRRPRPVRRAGAGARVRRPRRVVAPRADRLNPGSATTRRKRPGPRGESHPRHTPTQRADRPPSPPGLLARGKPPLKPNPTPLAPRRGATPPLPAERPLPHGTTPNVTRKTRRHHSARRAEAPPPQPTPPRTTKGDVTASAIRPSCLRSHVEVAGPVRRSR